MSYRFTHLYLENWRNFRKVDIRFQDRVFILGPNASGKTNLLDAIRFLRDIAKRKGSLVSAVEQRGGMAHLRSLHARQASQVTVKVELDLEGARWVRAPPRRNEETAAANRARAGREGRRGAARASTS